MGTRGPGAVPKPPRSESEHSLGATVPSTQPYSNSGNVALCDPVGTSGSASQMAQLPLAYGGATHTCKT